MDTDCVGSARHWTRREGDKDAWHLSSWPLPGPGERLTTGGFCGLDTVPGLLPVDGWRCPANHKDSVGHAPPPPPSPCGLDSARPPSCWWLTLSCNHKDGVGLAPPPPHHHTHTHTFPLWTGHSAWPPSCWWRCPANHKNSVGHSPHPHPHTPSPCGLNNAQPPSCWWLTLK